jgi:hypothetical protein
MNSSTISITSMGMDAGRVPLSRQKDRDLGVTRPDQAKQLDGAGVILVAIQVPIEEDGVNRRVGGDHGMAVLRGGCLDDADIPAAQLLDQGVGSPPGGRGLADLIIHHEGADLHPPRCAF